MVRLHLVYPGLKQKANVTLVRRVITAFREKNRSHVHRVLFRGNQGHPLFLIALLVYQVNLNGLEILSSLRIKDTIVCTRRRAM